MDHDVRVNAMNSRQKDERLVVTAYHEAGHALADHRLGFKIKWVTIVGNAEAAGRTHSNLGLKLKVLEYGYPSSATVARWHDKIVSILAGGEAQRRYSPHSIRSYMMQGDRESVVDILMRLHPAEAEMRAVFKYLKIRTSNLIGQPRNWGMIRDLARALLKRKTLTGDEVKAVFHDAFQRQTTEWRRKGE